MANEATHTPGPWTIVGEADLPQHDDLMIVAFGVAAQGEIPDDSLYVCNVGSDGGTYGAIAPVAAGDKWPVSLANAKLIAAAPDLADALAEYVAEVDRDGMPSAEWSDANLERMRAALRKAGRLP